MDKDLSMQIIKYYEEQGQLDHYLESYINSSTRMNLNYICVLADLYTHGSYYDAQINRGSLRHYAPSVLQDLQSFGLVCKSLSYKYTLTDLGKEYTKAIFKNKHISRHLSNCSFLWMNLFMLLGFNNCDGNLYGYKFAILVVLLGTLALGKYKMFPVMCLLFLFLTIAFSMLNFVVGSNETGVKAYNIFACEWMKHTNPRLTKGYFFRFLLKHHINLLKQGMTTSTVNVASTYGMFGHQSISHNIRDHYLNCFLSTLTCVQRIIQV